jgi:hypothetical protein
MKKFFLPVALFFLSLNTYAFFISDTINAPYLVSSFLVADTGITTTNVSINYSLEGGVASGIYYDGPMGMANGIILTTGLAQSAMPPNDGSNMSTNLGMPGNSTLVNNIVGGSVESYDTIVLMIKFDVDIDINSIVFDFIFGSEEYPEYVGSKFNDCFGVFLNDTQIVFDQFGNPITINGSFFSSGYVKIPPENGLEYDGSTNVLVCKAPVAPGSTNNVLKFVISDVGDANYDSGVLIARLRGSADIITTPVTDLRTPTPTFTISMTFTNSPTITTTFTITKTHTITETFTISPTHSISPTFSNSPTITQTATITPTHSVSPTFTVTPTFTDTPTVTPTPITFELILKGNFPNPFALNTKIVYKITKEAKVTIKIFTVSGEVVNEYFVREGRGGIEYNVFVWNGKNKNGKEVSSGVYIYKISAVSVDGENAEAMSKMTVVK